MNNKQLEKSQKENKAETDAALTGMSDKLEALADSTNEALEATGTAIDEIKEGQSAVLAAIAKIQMPVAPNKTVDAMEQDLGPETVFDDSNIGEARVLDVDSPEFKDKAELLRFYAEPVTVMIHETAEEQADSNFAISVNGVPEVFWRGETKTVKRMYVEGLCRAKPVAFGNVEYTDDAGVRKFKWPASRGLRYGFTVVEDKNPRGGAWLRRTLAEPN